MLLLEFTIEPFHEGNPGPHVTAAVAAAELGVAAIGDVRVEGRHGLGQHGAVEAQLVAELLDRVGADRPRRGDAGLRRVNISLDTLRRERFATREQAVQLCSSLKSAGGDCVVQSN